MKPRVAYHLLTQDNSIPGNRKDGFRYHHLLFIVLVTPIYLWFELAFGVTLLDTMSGNVIIDDTRVIEHWGRLISGFAFALLMLSIWVRVWEREAMHWLKGALISLAIVLSSILVSWWAQARLLNFYVERTSQELPWAVASLIVLPLSAFFPLLLWHNKTPHRDRIHYLWLSLGAIAILLVVHGLSLLIEQSSPSREQELGAERQQTATLTVIRRGLQEDIYKIPGAGIENSSLKSPSGKAFLSLFPIFGVIYDQKAFADARPQLIGEFMYLDWQRDFGEQAYAAYKDVDDELRHLYESSYRGLNKALVLGGRTVPPGLRFEKFRVHPAVMHHFRQQLACLDCIYIFDMSREEFGREFHRNAKALEVDEALTTFADPEKFERGRTGDRAARTYWAPILALLFSMLGMFTHTFNLLVTTTAYFHRLTFRKLHAADSPLANEVIANNKRVTAAAVIGLALFAYFYDNQITGNPSYIEKRPILWEKRPIAGAIAAHWTVNAQSLIYPFTKKIAPTWISFSDDPLQHIPVVRSWFSHDE